MPKTIRARIEWKSTPATKENRPELFITYAWNEPDEAWVLDVSGSLEETRRSMRGRAGFVYRFERTGDGLYDHAQFIEELTA